MLNILIITFADSVHVTA